MAKANKERTEANFNWEYALSHYFVSRKDAFAQWNRDKSEWQCIRKDIPSYLIKSHLEGKITIATYPVNELCNTPCVCFDLDSKTPEAYDFLKWLRQWFKEKEVLFLFEDTGGRGLHGWCLFLCYVSAVKAIAIANLALDDFQKTEGTLPCPVEVFPKQASPKDVGNPIRVPLGLHQSGNYSHFLNTKLEPDNEAVLQDIQNGKRTTEFDLDKILPEGAVKKVKRKKESQLVQPDERWGEIIPQGNRHNTLVSLAAELRARKFSPEKVLSELKIHNQQRCQPPLGDSEVEHIAKGMAEKTASEFKEIESYATNLVNMLIGCSFFHNTVGDPFIRFNHNEHLEIWPLDSRNFEDYAKYLFYKKEGKVPSSNAINDAIGTLSGKAKFDGPMHNLNCRVAWHDDALWYDLADDKWQAVRIDKEGWQLIDKPPIIFQRYPHMLPQVEPTPGGDVKQVLPFLNLSNDNDKVLLMVWLVSAFIPGFPHPGLMPYGSWGSGKTMLFRLLKSIIDPSAIETMSFATDRVEFAQQLEHHWAAFYDNVHSIPRWTSDLLCRAVTGEGFSKRRLYSNSEDIVFKFRRIIGVDGLELAAESPDLLDRSIILELEPIPDNKRREELEIWALFTRSKNEILGGIFDTLSLALGIYPDIDVGNLPRMADWAKWGCAIAEALPFGKAQFLQSYGTAIKHQSLEALKANLLGEALLTFMANKIEYEDTVSGLLKNLTSQAEGLSIDTKGKGWPKQPNQLSKTLKAMKPNLGKEGLILEFLGHTKEGTRVVIKSIDKTSSPPSPRYESTSDDGILNEKTTVTRELASGDDSDDKTA